MEPEDLSFQFLWEITDGFSEKRELGEGAFGKVYRGVTKNREEVAVKLLKIRDLNQHSKQFQNEFYNLNKLSHPNVVKVLGYCYETEKKLFPMPGRNKFVEEMHTALCFEYLQNGSLQKHLYDKSCEVKLEWQTRFKIIKGTCEGLKYIHNLEKPIYHLDLKPDNILLDKDMLPKIADFGLSRIFVEGLKRTTSRPYGTLGYQPPEYIKKGEISGKYDIFSLGVIMIRIVSGPESYPRCLDMSSDGFIDQVQGIWRKRLQATSSSDSLIEAYCHQVMTCTWIALSCLENDSLKRPDIVNITEMLNETEARIGKLTTKGRQATSQTTKHHSNEEMRGEPQDITGRQQSINFRSSIRYSELEPVDARETSSNVVEELIVGRKEEKDEIITCLLQVMSEKIVILPIHGIGGIGKTTFVRLIYNDQKFKHYSHAWVDVPQRFDMDRISDSIIKQISEKESQDNERKMVHRCLEKLLPGKKIMIVLDDLWEENQFKLNELKEKLYNDSSNIIILVTTRSERVAKRIYTKIQPYNILPLTNDMCWDIIKQRSNFESRDDKEQLACMAQEIAKKCGGVALAAQSLGFTLRDMKFDQWMEVKDNEIWNEHTSNVSLPNQVLASLMLSYSYLEQSLQLCFTYCAVFPKGHKIVKKDLVYQWISLGLIEPNKLLSDLEQCEKYIVQLLGLSFLQVSPKASELYHEEATFFTMHDLVHDLALSLLGNKLLDKRKQENNLGRSRHCKYALLGDCSMPMWLTSAPELRALHFLDCRSTELHGAVFAPVASLRVLYLSECFKHKLPDSIGVLKELRYLNAPGTQDLEFPECITKLSHLIFLNLHGSAIKEIPESIGKMENLMHLDLSGCGIRRLPKSFSRLQKLVHVDFSECSAMIFGESESLWGLSQLEHLSLSGCTINVDLAKALCRLTKLQYLDLSHVFCFGKPCSGLQEVLVKFTKLRYLDIRRLLDYNSVVRAEIGTFIEAISGLSSLEYLNLGWNRNLCKIPKSIGRLSKLRTLDLSHCVNLEMLPAAIFEINNMKYVHLAGCDRLDKNNLPTVLLLYFKVHAGDSEFSSNLCELQYEDPTKLEIVGLENVMSAGEAQRIKLGKKKRIKELGFVWTRDAKRFNVEDKDVLKQLVPPSTVRKIRLKGYNDASFPYWMMHITTYVQHLVNLTLEDMPNCSSLPPFGQLPNLEHLRIGRMDSIRKIGQDLYGTRGSKKRVFRRLQIFELWEMKCLEEWNTSYSYSTASGEDSLNKELVFPKLRCLVISGCPMLRFKSMSIHKKQRFKSLSPLVEQTSLLPLGKNMTITCSDQSSLKCSAKFDAVTWLCEVPLHQWSLFRYLPSLTELRIVNCSDITCRSTDLLRCVPSFKTLSVRDCKSIAVLPKRLGDFTSLEELEIINCEGIKALPESIQQLTHLHCLKVDGCPQLVQLGCPPSLVTLSLRDCKGLAQLLERLGDLTSLKNLEINNWGDVKALPESIQQLTNLQRLQIKACPQLVQLPQRLGDLSSLKNLEIIDCEGVKALPKSIRLTCLQCLKTDGCPQLAQWCKSEENKMNLALEIYKSIMSIAIIVCFALWWWRKIICTFSLVVLLMCNNLLVHFKLIHP